MQEKPPWVDISVPLKTGMVRYPGDPPVNISRLSGEHEEEPLVSVMSLCVHAGTHVDAPLHFLREGKGIDMMPVEAMVGPVRIMDITQSDVISLGDLEGQDITQGERLLFKTRISCLWERDAFAEDYVHLSPEGAFFLAQKGVIAIGIDYLSIAGFDDNSSEVHRILLEAGIWIIEGLNLSGIEPGNYDLLCLPLLIAGVEAAPARVMVRPLQIPGPAHI
jgi:arylformamidase